MSLVPKIDNNISLNSTWGYLVVNYILYDIRKSPIEYNVDCTNMRKGDRRTHQDFGIKLHPGLG